MEKKRCEKVEFNFLTFGSLDFKAERVVKINPDQSFLWFPYKK